MTLNKTVEQVTDRIRTRSRDRRSEYLERVEAAINDGPRRAELSCSNLAHACAAMPDSDKSDLKGNQAPNLAIITAYNDMLSAHQPFESYPSRIRDVARATGGTAQVASGVPAMCDGVTQGQPGMDLSLFSRDVIAMSTAVGLSHNVYDAALYLGICDKIVPGLMIGALTFGHLPAIFVPAGPMVSGLPNDEKNMARQLYAEGKIGRAELLDAESQSYHAPGTCTFYGTANSNQMLMEIMGLHLPGASFINPNTPLRDALTTSATRRALAITALGNEFTPIAKIVDERVLVNGIVGLHATGGSTNLTLHLVAIARAAGIEISWDDFADLSGVVPLLTRIYPNGPADVNRFQAAGGMSVLISELLTDSLLHEDVQTVFGPGLAAYTKEPKLDDAGDTTWSPGPQKSLDPQIIASAMLPHSPNGGLRVLDGNLGRSVIKVSAVKPEFHLTQAPAVIFHSQEEFQNAFEAGKLDRDFVAVMRFQGPKACGMPELHKLTPPLGVLQDKGFKVALITDGRMSGASGKIPAAIHLTPEAVDGGPIAKLRDGDLIRLDADAGTLEVLIEDSIWNERQLASADLSASRSGIGRELFSVFRAQVGSAETGASVF